MLRHHITHPLNSGPGPRAAWRHWLAASVAVVAVLPIFTAAARRAQPRPPPAFKRRRPFPWAAPSSSATATSKRPSTPGCSAAGRGHPNTSRRPRPVFAGQPLHAVGHRGPAQHLLRQFRLPGCDAAQRPAGDHRQLPLLPAIHQRAQLRIDPIRPRRTTLRWARWRPCSTCKATLERGALSCRIFPRWPARPSA